MATVLLDKQIQQYWPLLRDDEKRAILSVIKCFLKRHENSGLSLTIEEYNQDLKTAEDRIDSGHFFTQEDVEEMAKKW
jgi:hypothetical protein